MGINLSAPRFIVPKSTPNGICNNPCNKFKDVKQVPIFVTTQNTKKSDELHVAV